MQLKFSGAPEINAPIGLVWKRLIDIVFVASCVTDVDEIVPVDDRNFDVLTSVRFGIARFQFRVKVALHDIDDPHRASMTARAKATGADVIVNTSIRLDSLDERSTQLHWDAVADLRGIIARVGARLLEKEGRETIGEFWDEFSSRVTSN